ncbi:hypothetical protein GYMLUDRAFT_418296 [Collybiopsis luxurians FD-317 M1]|uniref:Uncharacterized protein n=1 Tax=Collybiopsis luxurians FD-317 M1 TaxID=944289 RepID=A0A0D0BZQ2_9AGAR|nr:hypothetical protein GYMLUDRAFT_418296 [Collybiopsis luxurians FD-317 M1]
MNTNVHLSSPMSPSAPNQNRITSVRNNVYISRGPHLAIHLLVQSPYQSVSKKRQGMRFVLSRRKILVLMPFLTATFTSQGMLQNLLAHP